MMSMPSRSKGPPTGIGVRNGWMCFPTLLEAHTLHPLFYFVMSHLIFGHQYVLLSWLCILASLR